MQALERGNRGWRCLRDDPNFRKTYGNGRGDMVTVQRRRKRRAVQSASSSMAVGTVQRGDETVRCAWGWERGRRFPGQTCSGTDVVRCFLDVGDASQGKVLQRDADFEGIHFVFVGRSAGADVKVEER